MGNIRTESVYSLVVDIIESTRKIMNYTTEERDSFNEALSKVLSPFIKNLDLEDSIIKFTGDGWIISISGPNKIINLVSLAILLKNKFNSEMEKLARMKFDQEWNSKFGLAYGKDIRVKFNKQDDFVGDSIRRATRVSTLCYPNEILIDSTVWQDIFRDFETKLINKDRRIRQLGIDKFEYDILHIFSIREPKIGKLKDSFIKLYLFDQIGIEAEKELIINRVKKEADNQRLSSEGKRNIDLTSIYLSTIIGRSKDSEIIDKKLKKVGYKRSVIYWNKKVNISSDYQSAKSVLDEMRSAGIQPNVVTYSTLVNKVDSYESAKSVLDEMRSAGIQPNEVTYSTLMNKVDSYESAKSVLEEMRSAGIQPNHLTYCTLFSKDINNCTVEDVHKWYLSERNCSSSALEPLIKRLFYEKRFQGAYYLILNHPHLETARKIVVRHLGLSISMYNYFKGKDFYEKNIDYALGIAYFDIGKLDKAIRHLKKAFSHAVAEKRKAHIRSLLKEGELKLHRNT